jgi:DNA-binding MarR family transcriptional regulator
VIAASRVAPSFMWRAVNPDEDEPCRADGAVSIAFLLTQLGTHAADRFAARIASLDLTPPQAGILRAIAVEPGRSQQALSEQLRLLPSRVVAFVDDLERRGYVERRRNAGDRRLYALHLTARGGQLMMEIGKLGMAHEDEIAGSLSAAQRTALARTLQALAADNGLTAGVHPGYKSLGEPGPDTPAAG